ncbi:putative bifunctional diguanylate cyclase/phosphodiesterase [Simiduia agarivorans]|uniref:cyclic-guanylate-specific phosphodiesterase n=1 Tax=Simiduia agarivorans (strain DSM 21679 / JCM 13881 / BCRC 17597 / SA1) TaxID=1117647 RepID=K4KI61_SIMAS|nr:EAL domain-containing protein [Simiduia agarivorans]AFU98829.2 diguanylate cyclase domain-containing protein [Simiduia agarivorans SA1 = DSM 21679]
MTDSSPPISEVDQFRARRLRQVMRVVAGGLLLAAITNLPAGFKTTSILLLATGTMLYGLHRLKQGHIDTAAAVLLWTLSLTLTVIVTLNTGLRDPAMMGYPAILIFAALFSRRRQFMYLFGFILLAATVQAIAHIYEWRDTAHSRVDWTNVFDVLIILSIIGFAVRFQAYDLRRALVRLEHENRRYRQSEERASYLAQYDALTGLPNRTLCEDRFTQMLKRAKRSDTKSALLFIDLDNFKTINDSLGHSAGDRLLVNVANSLNSCLRATDTACRFGGDEFIVLLADLHSAQEAETVANKILHELGKPIESDQHFFETSASIGIAMAPTDGTDFESYCRHADIAMYQAKKDGKNLYRFFDPTMNRLSEERFRMIGGLRKALKDDEFVLYYQPKVNLQTGRWIGAEALLRWQHPSEGLLSPARFIDLAEETGLIVGIGQWVLKQACHQCIEWHKLGYRNLQMAVNLSPVQFTRGNLTAEVRQALDASGLAGHHLELELTESLLLRDAENIRTQLNELRTHGISFSIDDFGTGYSNLGYLSKFQLEALKVDQSFVRKLLSSKQDQDITLAIINIAKSLGLVTVAEGIEDEETLTKLKSMGCEMGQGYFWSKPLPVDEFTDMLARYAEDATQAHQS